VQHAQGPIRASSRRGALLLACLGAGCVRAAPPAPDATSQAAVHDEARARMVRAIAAMGIAGPAVLAAMARVPRHEFVPAEQQPFAYENRPLPIGERQTISAPGIVALMTELAALDRRKHVLEVGTGSGYQAAILAEIAGEVWTIEIVEPLAERARRTLARLGYRNVHTRVGDGYAGWPEAAPFDAILVTAAPAVIPGPLKEQLAPGGRLVIPVGELLQDLVVVTRTPTGFEERTVTGVRFVPMTGRARR